MGCCISSIEINVDDLRPYSFVFRLGRSYNHFFEMMALRRQARSVQEIVRRLTLDQRACSRQIEQVQLDIRCNTETAALHQKAGNGVLYQSSMQEVRRLERHARRIMNLRSLANLTIRQLVEESVGADMIMTLERYTQVPFIRYGRERLDKLITNVQKRMTLTSQQTEELRSLLIDIDDGEEEAENLEELSAISSAPETSPEELQILEQLSPPPTTL